MSIYKSFTGIDVAGDHIINKVGEIIQYQVAVKNNGNVDLTGISVDDPMVTLTKSSGDHTDPGVLNPGETWVYTGDYAVTQANIDSVGENGIGLITNTAIVKCDEHAPESSSIDCSIILTRHIGPTPGESIPVADFSTSVASGYAPLAVQFIDKSTGSPISWSWNFGDGTPNSSEISPTHTYTTPGTYNANLTVSNANGSSSPKTETIIVTQTSSSSGGGRSGSANVVGSSSGSTDTRATANVIQPEKQHFGP